jgi:hypothetical protein
MMELMEGPSMNLGEALDFAMGRTDLGYRGPSDDLRRIMGVLVLDTLQYNEYWRLAQLVRLSLAAKWPGFFCD